MGKRTMVVNNQNEWAMVYFWKDVVGIKDEADLRKELGLMKAYYSIMEFLERYVREVYDEEEIYKLCQVKNKEFYIILNLMDEEYFERVFKVWRCWSEDEHAYDKEIGFIRGYKKLRKNNL